MEASIQRLVAVQFNARMCFGREMQETLPEAQRTQGIESKT